MPEGTGARAGAQGGRTHPAALRSPSTHPFPVIPHQHQGGWILQLASMISLTTMRSQARAADARPGAGAARRDRGRCDRGHAVGFGFAIQLRSITGLLLSRSCPWPAAVKGG